MIFLFLSTDFWILKISAQSRQGTKQSKNHFSLRLRVLVREMQNSSGKIGNQTRKMPFFAQKWPKNAKKTLKMGSSTIFVGTLVEMEVAIKNRTQPDTGAGNLISRRIGVITAAV
ncbi:MAG: hypothetical protein PHD86_05630 [Kiritimatiellae bacterium]|nr:hypothetical protein [Kiritimatiellia bacterium]